MVERAAPARRSPAAICLGLLVFLSCFPVVVTDLTPNAPAQFDFHALVFPADLALLAAIVLAARRRRLPPLAGMAGVVLVTFCVAYLAHPSIRGAGSLVRWAGVVAIVALADRATVVTVTGAWAVAEALIAAAQKIHDGPLGLGFANEGGLSFVRFGHALAPPGTLAHPYLLAGLALLGGTVLARAARERRWLLVPAAIAVAPVGFTYSRAALLALALVLVAFLVARFPAAILALAIGVGAPALLWSDGWVSRAGGATTAAPGNGLDTGRTALMRQSATLIREHPLTGVGPGLYVTALRKDGVDPRASGGVLKPVHNLPLLAGAEGGAIAGLAMLALLGGAGIVALRSGPATLAVYLAFLPFCLLDHFGYTYQQGLVMTGLWIAAISTAERPRRVRRADSPQ